MKSIYVDLYKYAEQDIPMAQLKTLLHHLYQDSLDRETMSAFAEQLYSTWIEKAIAIANINPDNISQENLLFYFQQRANIDQALGIKPKEGAFSSKAVKRIFKEQLDAKQESDAQLTPFLQHISDTYFSNDLPPLKTISDKIRTTRGDTLLPGFDLKDSALETAAQHFAKSLSMRVEMEKVPNRDLGAKNPERFFEQRKQQIEDTKEMLNKSYIQSFLD